jgi:hypothetical protein
VAVAVAVAVAAVGATNLRTLRSAVCHSPPLGPWASRAYASTRTVKLRAAHMHSARPVGAKRVSGRLAVAHYVCQAAAARGASSPAAAAACSAAIAQGCCQLPLEAYHCPGMWLLLARCQFASFWLAMPPVQLSSSCSAPSSHSCTRSDGRHARGGVLANCAFLTITTALEPSWAAGSHRS